MLSLFIYLYCLISHMIRRLLLLTVFHLFASYCFAQSLDISITRGTDLDFTFTTIRQYTNGVIRPNATEFRVESSAEWDLYVGAQTTTPGQWDLLTAYSSAGSSTVPVSILEIRAVSHGGTSQQNNFFQLRDVSNPVYLIGSGADDALVNSGVGTNALVMALIILSPTDLELITTNPLEWAISQVSIL